MKKPEEAEASSAPERLNFIQARIQEDLAQGRTTELHTRFPPEPNGFLHIGHAKAICINFGLAREFGGLCNLRFDDTNPVKEDTQYVDSILEDVRWLGFDWGERLFYASDHFERLYAFAVRLIEKGKAYVDDLPLEEMRRGRGSLTSAGTASPYRDRSVEENLDLFQRMRAGEFEDGARTLRAKIDMAATNLKLRDPVLYRILHAHHHRTGDEWCIYPTYDFAHGQSDAFEGITHSLCSLEFENHRPLYDWLVSELEDKTSTPTQIEFARLNLTYVVLSKRKLLTLVQEGLVDGWDDPRMPTLSGLRRRGYTPEAVIAFCDRIGVAKFNSRVDMVVLENALREDLNRRAPRFMGVLDPVPLVIENYPEGESEELEAVNNPEDPAAGKRPVPFGGRLWVEREDVRAEAPKKFFRLTPGREVRLRYAYYVTCREVVTDPATGEVLEVRCTYDPETRGGDSADGRKVKGTIHWVSQEHAFEAEVRLYDHLFAAPDPEDAPDGDFRVHLNPDSLQVVRAQLEPALQSAEVGQSFQLERKGYFCIDRDSRPGALVLNRSVALRDSWAKLEKRSK